MKQQFRNHAGVPLGGIGAGKVELCPDGAFRNLTFHNNIDVPIGNKEMSPEFDKEGIRGCLLGTYVEGYGAVALKEKDQDGIDTLPEGAIEYHGRLPFINTKYPSMDGIDVSMEAFSSLILDDPGDDDYKDSCIPAACFTLKAANNSDKARYVSFVFSWYNMIGMGGYPSALVNDRRDNFIEFKKYGEFDVLHFGHKKPKLDRRLEGNYSLVLGHQKDLETSYMVWPPTFLNIARGEGMWDTYKKEGKLPNVTMPAAETETDIYGALSAGKILKPGETLVVPFILSWYFPDRVANKMPDIIYKNIYTRWFKDSMEVAMYFDENKDRLRRKTREWQEHIEASNLPKWLHEKLINDIFPLYSGSFYSEDGRFSANEAPSDMNGCMGTIDQRAASNSVYTMCFPKLSKSELKLFGDQQIDEDHEERYGEHWNTLEGTFGKVIDRLGAIRHDIGWDELEGGKLGSKYWTNLHWPDLVTAFTLQAYEQYTWTGDKEFLDYVYPKVKLALRFEQELDQDGDGVADLWGPGSNTYDNDNFPYYGTSSFVASLYLAAMKAAIKMAELKEDHDFIRELEERIIKATDTMETKLWDEELGYYLSWVDQNHEAWSEGERPHAYVSTNCMIAQIAGQWFANMMNLGDLLDKQRIHSAISKMEEKNVDLVKYCPANEVSEDDKWLSFSWPYYIETYFAANAIYEGNVEAGLKVLKNIYKGMYEVDGSPWSAPLAWEGPDNGQRGWGKWYMTNPASWFILPALGGINYNAVEQELMLMPNVPKDLGVLEALPIFMPLFWGAIDSHPGQSTFKVTKLIKVSELQISRIVLKEGDIKLSVNDVEIPYTTKDITEGKATILVDIRLEQGDCLKVEY